MAKQYLEVSPDLLAQIAVLSRLDPATRLSNEALVGYGFDGLNLYYQNMGGFNLSNTTFKLANLRLAQLGGSNLSGADFTGADMEEINLIGAIMVDALLIDCGLGNFADLSGANLSGATLRNAVKMILPGRPGVVKMISVNLTGATLQDFIFSPEYHSDLILDESDLRGADLSRINMMEHRFSTNGAIYNGNTKFPENFVPRRHAMRWAA
jgi:uncharacterized protein YjbI with pentapeptide repeats